MFQHLYWWEQWKDQIRAAKKQTKPDMIEAHGLAACICQANYLCYAAQYWSSISARGLQ